MSFPAEKKKSGSIVLGNIYDKYGSRNPVARRLFEHYLKSLRSMVDGIQAERILEVGCGEGYLSRILRELWPRASILGVDLSPLLFDRQVSTGQEVQFLAQSAYELGLQSTSVDLVVGAEVLEHLARPQAALAEMHRVARGPVLLSVPREPIWRILNMVRGAYLSSLGNTPGHLQHWSSRGFFEFVSNHFEVVLVKRPLPWTMILARKRNSFYSGVGG